jgi:hypothetical protein
MGSTQQTIAGKMIAGISVTRPAAALLGLLALIGSSAVAQAQWQVVSAQDGSAGRGARQAVVASRAGDATLRFACVNGAPLLTIEIDRDLMRGIVDSVVTFDNSMPQPVLLQVFSNPRSVPLFDVSLRDIARAKRLRLEFKPIEAPPLAYEFDTRGGKKAMAAVVCGVKKRSLFRRLAG